MPAGLGTKTPFAFGKTLTTELANYEGPVTYQSGPGGNSCEETTPVNHFEVTNAWGLYDMHGNVHEWCADHWHTTYEGAPTDGSAWLLSDEDVKRLPCGESEKRVIRGGSYNDMPSSCRSAFRRGWYATNVGNDGFGFRVACSAP